MITFLQRYSLRIVIGVVLVLVAFAIISVCNPYFREQRIARLISSADGTVTFQFAGPGWVPASLRNWIPFWNRIRDVGLTGKPGDLHLPSQIPENVFVELRSLTHLRMLSLNDPHFCDNDLDRLRGLNRLQILDLSNTQITDAGLVNLKSYPSLILLDLSQTRTTKEGRELLGKALPECMITPEP